jgi:2-dehydro-3-deoxygalactonokinase
VIAVDWGTSGFRAYRLDSQGNILDSRAAAKGILSVPAGRFPEVLEEQVGDWIAQGEAPIVMSGMVGSRQSWVEAPYVPCPAGFAEIAAALREVRWGERHAWIVPGLSCRDAAGVHDVMRGEEVQVLGGLEADAGRVCLPGTHSKWVVVANKKITGFSTYMTGETYAVLKQHSILGRMMEEGMREEKRTRALFPKASRDRASRAASCIISSACAREGSWASSVQPRPLRIFRGFSSATSCAVLK